MAESRPSAVSFFTLGLVLIVAAIAFNLSSSSLTGLAPGDGTQTAGKGDACLDPLSLDDKGAHEFVNFCDKASADETCMVADTDAKKDCKIACKKEGCSDGHIVSGVYRISCDPFKHNNLFEEKSDGSVGEPKKPPPFELKCVKTGILCQCEPPIYS